VRGRPRPHHILAPAALAGLLAGSDVAPVEAAPDQEGRANPGAYDRWVSLEREADHPDPERRVRLAAQLPSELAALSDLERARQVASWSTAASPRVRLAIARALRYSPRAPGTLTAIEHLAADRSPSVRVAIAEAAWLRRREHPRRLIHVLHRLADDDHVFVREVARLALGDA
jgi:hypothetical protein